MSARVVYLVTGIFDKGGISRYARYQVQAIRDTWGEQSVRVLSLLPPDAHGFEEPFALDFASFGSNRLGKTLLAVAATAAALADRPRIVWAAHVNLAPLAYALARATGAEMWLNVYGIEVWSGLTRLRVRALRSADRLLSDCHATLDYVLNEGLHRRGGTSVHWDCVGVERFSPGDDGGVLQRYGVPLTEPRPFTLLTLARLQRVEGYKGVDRLIEVVSRLKGRDVQVRLVVAGEGDARPDYERQVKELGLTEQVFFTGRVSEADLPLVYRSCDVFSMITDAGHGRGEGLPLTPIEAAACGKPILVGNQDGSREAVEDGKTGYLFEPNDLEAIAERVEALARDAATCERVGQAARQFVMTHFSYDLFRTRLSRELATVR